jgi:hypothetical protein
MPPEGSLPKATAPCRVWPVVMLKLDVRVENVPLLFPAPDGDTVDTAAIGNGLGW